MSWKTLYIKSDNYIYTKNNWIVIKNKKDKSENKFFLEDIKIIIADNTQSIISIKTLNKIIDNNIPIIFCNDKHDPNSILLGMNIHKIPLQNFQKQIDLNQRKKNIIWQQLIISKVENSIFVLKEFNVSDELINKMNNIKKRINQGDTLNKEAEIAKIFFKEIYGSNFVRHQDDGINAMINFGYKIIASYISRTIVSYGLHPSLGIWHSNKTNYFNLSYDFIEPYRPIVDYYINKMDIKCDKNLDYETRINILKILDINVVFDNKITKLYSSIDLMIKSFISFLHEKTSTLITPKIYPL